MQHRHSTMVVAPPAHGPKSGGKPAISRQLWAALALSLGLLIYLLFSIKQDTSRMPHMAAGLLSRDERFTRALVADTPWAVDASAQLQQWRSDLLPRVLRAYTALEKAEYGTPEGAKKEITRLEPWGHSRYDLFTPVVTCPGGKLARVGSKGDGGKWLCTDAELLGGGPGSSSGGGSGGGGGGTCVIYSIGSRGQYDFENAMLAATPCVVHTFDCHYKGGKSVQPGRHYYHKICLGDKTELRTGDKKYMTLQDITQLLGHSVIHLLKIDIEGFEYEVISGLKFADSCTFPLQLSMEVHHSVLYHLTPFKGDRNMWDNMLWPMHSLSMAELALFFQHLADLGYAIASREDNPLHWCCSEFTFVRVERPAHCAQR